MRVYLVRHAEADPGEPDEARVLNETGRRQARELGQRLAASGVRFDAVLTSPLVRARQTGELVAEPLGLSAETVERLGPGATTDDLRAAVAGRGDTVIAIAHQPDCGRIAAELTGDPEPKFPAAGVVELHVTA